MNIIIMRRTDESIYIAVVKMGTMCSFETYEGLFVAATLVCPNSTFIIQAVPVS